MLIVKTYIGYLDSKWIYFDEENEVFQISRSKKYFELDNGCCSTCSLSFKRNC